MTKLRKKANPANNIKIVRNDSISRSVVYHNIMSIIIDDDAATFLIYLRHYQHLPFLMTKMKLTEAETVTVRNLSSTAPAQPGTVS